MSVSFEDALSTLTAMFPEWDRETLSVLLTSNGYHVERTIENVLSMSGEMSAQEQQQQEQQQQQRTSFTSQSNGPVAAPGSSTSTSAPPKRSRRKGPRVNTDKDAPYRGIRQELPDDFLRPPTGKGGPIIADEELALMLQNELFQKEVHRMLGDEFFQEQRQRGGINGNNSNISGPNSRRGSKAGGEDLGILKALSSMGSAAKKNLSSLAERFQGKNSNNANTQHVMQYGESAGESGTSREFKSLVGGNDDDDEDEEDEVISFGGSSAGNNRSHLLDDEPTSNPLIQAGGTNTINGGKKNK